MTTKKMKDFDFVSMGRIKDQAKTNLYHFLPWMMSPPKDKDLESNFH